MRDISFFYLDNSVPKGSIVVECGRLLERNNYRIKIQGNCFVEFAVSLTTIIIIRLPIKSPLPHTAV